MFQTEVIMEWQMFLITALVEKALHTKATVITTEPPTKKGLYQNTEKEHS